MRKSTIMKRALAGALSLVACFGLLALPVNAGQAPTGSDRSGEFSISSLSIKINGEEAYNSTTGGASIDLTAWNRPEIVVDMSWTALDLENATMLNGDYAVFEVCTVTGANVQDLTGSQRLYDDEQTYLGDGQLVFESGRLYYRVVFAASIEGKKNIEGSMNGSGKMYVTSVDKKISINREGESIADIEIVDPPPPTSGNPTGPVWPGEVPVHAKESAGVSSSNGNYLVKWDIKIYDFAMKQFVDAKNNTSPVYDDLIFEEILDSHQTFDVTGYYDAGVTASVKIPIFLYDSGNPEDSKLKYTEYFFYLGQQGDGAKIVYHDPGTDMPAAEAHVKANPLTWTVVKEQDPDIPTKMRERLIVNWGAPGSTGLHISDVADMQTLLNDLAAALQNCNNVITAADAVGSPETTMIPNPLKTSERVTLAEWRKFKSLYEDSYDYYNVTDASGTLTGPYVHALGLTVTTKVNTADDDTNIVRQVKNKYRLSGGFTEFSDEASQGNEWTGTISATATMGDLLLVKADALYNNDTSIFDGGQPDDVPGAIGNVSFEIYRGDGTGPLAFNYESGKYRYYASGATLTSIDTDISGMAIVTGLPPGNYYLKEITAPGGYYTEQNPRIDFSIADTKIEYVLAGNEPRGVRLTKVDSAESSTTLAGAVFELYSYSAGDFSDAQQVTGFSKTVIDGKEYWVYDGAGTDALQTGANGEISIVNLPAGKYYLVETTAPAGYQLSEEKHTFELLLEKPASAPAVVELGNITNEKIPQPATVERTVTKIWNDDDNINGHRPASIQVQLYANGVVHGTPVELNATNNWRYTWRGLAEKENGSTVVYTVKEITVSSKYNTIYSQDTFTITNYLIADPPLDSRPESKIDPPTSSAPQPKIDPPQNSQSSPATGDTPAVMWAALGLAVSALAILCVVLRRRRCR